METAQSIIDFVSQWRANNAHTLNSQGELSEQSLLKLLNDINSKIENVSFEPPKGGTRAYFYSNIILTNGDRAYTSQNYMDSIKLSDRSAYSVYDIKAAKLFNNRSFIDALSRTAGNEYLAARLMGNTVQIDPVSGKPAPRAPYAVDLGNGQRALSITDAISALYAQKSLRGDVFIIMPNADTNSVLYQTELRNIINNQSVDSINGKPIAELRARLTSNGLLDVFNYLKADSARVIVEDGLVKSNGQGGFDVNVDPFIKKPSESWLNNIEKQFKDNLPTFEKWVKSLDKAPIKTTAVESYIGKLNLNLSDTAQMTRSIKAMEGILGGDKAGPIAKAFQQIGTKNMAMYMAARPGVMKAFGAAGVVFIAADAAITLKNANDAFSKGDNYTGTKILHDWGWRTSFGLGAASASIKLGLPLALLAVAGVSMFASAPMAILTGMAVELLIGAAGWHIGSHIGGGIGDLIWSLMDQAGLLPARIDPIVLDINGLGITTKSVADGVYYDLDNNGFSEKTGWIDAKSGILVLDKDANGQIETGNELFGDRTILEDGKTASSGFAALAALDSNRDGIIDAKDDKFSKLRIWIDRDGDGFSAPDELMTLEEAGVKSLNLSHTFVGQVDENGNTIARVGSFTRTDGTTAEMKEFLLQRDTKDVQMTHSIEIPEDIMDMPELHPMGNTYSLRQAMARDESGVLKQLVQEFINDKGVMSRQAKLQDILFAWTGVTNINPKSRGSNFDARKLAALETVTGTSYRNSPTSSPGMAEAPILERSYAVLAESIYTMLSVQTNLRDVLRNLNYTIDLEAENPIKLDVTSVKAYLDEQLQTNEVAGERLLAEVTRVLRNRGMVSDSEFAELRAYFSKKSIRYQQIIDTAPITTLTGTDANETMNGVVDRDNVMTSGAGNDTLNGSNRNDLLYGDSGNDHLYAGTGNDTLVGGTGNDLLDGGEGDDTYIFNKGDGEDVIVDYKGIDTIQFGEGISPEDVIAKVVRNDRYVNLELSIKGSTDKISVRQHFGYHFPCSGYEEKPEYKVEKITFADGTIWNSKTIHDKAHDMSGTEDDDRFITPDKSAIIYRGLGGNDYIAGSIANDLLYGDDGNDEIHSDEGNDLLYGDSGNDHLYAGTGNDTLVGGTGNDLLDGGEGDDTYIFNKGDGEDRIFDANGLADEVRLGHESIDVVFERVNSSLRVRMPGSLDAITIDSWYNGDAYKIETFKSTDGNVITHTQIESLIQAMASFQNDTGMTWEQALSEQPSQVRSIVQEYWTVPTV